MYAQAYEQDATMAYEPEVSVPVRHNSGGPAMSGPGMNGVGVNGAYGGVRRDITPEAANMHTTWMDFVNQMSGMQ